MKQKNTNFTFVFAISVILLILIISGCTNTTQQLTDNNKQPLPDTKKDSDVIQTEKNIQSNLSQKMIKFENIEAVKEFLIKRQSQGGSSGSYSGEMMVKTASSASVGMARESVGAPALDSSANSDPIIAPSANDFSETNVQVKGVDEADFIKNDDHYIYTIADNQLVIVDAYDAKNAKIVSKTSISKEVKENSNENSPEYYDYYNTPIAKEMFINGNKLILLIQANEKSFYFEKYDIEPRPSYKQVTYAYLYDISDKSNPKTIEEFTMPGAYYQSRMIGNMVYLVSQDGVNYGQIQEPMVKWGSGRLMPPIYYFDNPEDNYQFNTITSINLDDEEVVDSKTLMMGYANTLMVSENNIYIAYQKNNYWYPRYYGWGYGGNDRYVEEQKVRFYTVIVPLLKGQIKTDIEQIMQKRIIDNEKWQETSEKLAKFYTQVENDEDLQNQYESMFGDIKNNLEEYDTKKELENKKTIIHKIKIDNGQIDHVAQGEVYGNLLNQFSLDEFKGNLRVATTVDIWNRKRLTYNNVYVLDANMKNIGKIENIAEDERIYSTRFLGNRLYMVTFKQMDPLFVIDLSNPVDPMILGKLKIPGFSNYLHPYDENHIIGVGKETAENEWGGVSTKGIKLALFDVSNVESPKEVDHVEIGDSGSDSAALYDHKAFLFSKDKNLLVIPVTEVTDRSQLDQYRFSNSIWHGAYAYKVTTSGFDLIGKVKHSSTKSDYWDWWNQATVLRSLYMDNNLYTVSNKYIKINDLANDLEELNSIKLPYDDNHYNYWWR